MTRPRLVLVGNGMAGVRTLEELLKLAPDLYDIRPHGLHPGHRQPAAERREGDQGKRALAGRQGARKLMAMISTAVNGLTRLESIVPAVQDLGRRHVKYGVNDQHYDTVAAALVWTLGQGLGEQFTPELKDAWVAAYGVLAKTMKDAAATVAA